MITGKLFRLLASRRNSAKASLNQRGDTLVEVMIVITVLSVVVVAAFSVANHAVAASRDAKEHTEALKLAETQLELLKSYAQIAGNNVTSNGFSSFCIDMSTTPPSPGSLAVDAATNPKCKNIDSTGTSTGLYSVKIVATGSPYPVYKVTVNWDQATTSSLKTGQVTLNYRLGG